MAGEARDPGAPADLMDDDAQQNGAPMDIDPTGAERDGTVHERRVRTANRNALRALLDDQGFVAALEEAEAALQNYGRGAPHVPLGAGLDEAAVSAALRVLPALPASLCNAAAASAAGLGEEHVLRRWLDAALPDRAPSTPTADEFRRARRAFTHRQRAARNGAIPVVTEAAIARSARRAVARHTSSLMRGWQAAEGEDDELWAQWWPAASVSLGLMADDAPVTASLRDCAPM